MGDFIYGLAVVSVIFEGIIIQCECTGGSISSEQDAPIIDVRENELNLPNDLIELIVSKTDYKTIKQAVRWGITPPTGPVMSEILQKHIILIKPHEVDGGIQEYYQYGDSFLRFGVYKELISFFERFSDQVRKIEIDYIEDIEYAEIHKKIIDHIKRCAKNLEELRLRTNDDRGFWKVLLDEENDLIFPKMKKFKIVGESKRNELKLNLIFPKLECLEVIGAVTDGNCLSNVKGLKELLLCTETIHESQFDHIFANNENIMKISLSMPEQAETMHSIAKHLTKLKTLEVQYPGEKFLFRTNNNDTVHKLPSVTHFQIQSDEIDELNVFGNGSLSFDMPHVKKLDFYGYLTDDQIVNFVNQFKELEIAEMILDNNAAIGRIEELKHIKGFTTIFNEHNFDFLTNWFKRFDGKSKLQTLKLIYFDESFYPDYEAKMNEINIHLGESGRPTWKLSHGKQIGTNLKYLMFIREPCTWQIQVSQELSGFMFTIFDQVMFYLVNNHNSDE